jgi:Xaa-Pro aminopeptidase
MSTQQAQYKEAPVLTIPKSAYENRVANIQKELAKEKIDALVALSIESRPWGSFHSLWLADHFPAAVVIPAIGAPMLAPQEFPPPRANYSASWVADKRWGYGWEKLLDHVAVRLRELNLTKGRIALAGDLTPLVKLKLSAELPRVDFQTQRDDLIFRLRLVKDEYEIGYMKRAGEIATAQFRRGLEVIRPGRRLCEVIADTLQEGLARGAALYNSTEFTGYSPEESSALSGGPPAHVLKSGETVLFEAVPYWGSYNVEIPVTYAIGTPTNEQRDLAQIDFEAFEAGLDAVKPGVPILDAVKAAEAVIKKHGFSRFASGFGHFIGIGNIEGPPIEADPGVVLQPGMTVALHGTLVSPKKEKHKVGCCWLITHHGKEPLTDVKLQPLFEV